MNPFRKRRYPYLSLRIRFRFLIIIAAAFLLMPPFSSATGLDEWKLSVSAESAVIRMKPEKQSASLLTVKHNTVLESQIKLGNWFRVIIKAPEDDIFVIGYIHSDDVAVIEEIIEEEQDDGGGDSQDIRGSGWSFKLNGGWNHFAAGDIASDTRDMFDAVAEAKAASGFSVEKEQASLATALDISGDVIFQLTSRIGIGLGGGYFEGPPLGVFYWSEDGLFTWQARSARRLTAIPVRLGVYYSVPISRKIIISLHGGSAVHFAKYSFRMNSDHEDFISILHNARATGFGVFGGIGLEFSLNSRIALVLEGRGRYARLDNFKGTETRSELDLLHRRVQIREDGRLYYLNDGMRSSLAILQNEPAGLTTSRPAVLDLSGLGFGIGFKFRF